MEKAIKNIPHNKSPGPDGYSSEYYQMFSHILSLHLHRIFEAAKACKEPNLLKNVIPISLLKVDVKLYAKLIVSEFLWLNKQINYDQVGFIMGRQTTDATRRIQNILHLMEKRGEPPLLLTLDAEKAFDRVHWGYLDKVLEKIQNAILELCSSLSAFVFTEGLFSKTFRFTNGTRQGCPCPL